MKYYCVKQSADNKRLSRNVCDSTVYGGELLTAREINKRAKCAIEADKHPFFVAVNVPRGRKYWIFGTRRTSDKYTPLECRL